MQRILLLTLCFVLSLANFAAASGAAKNDSEPELVPLLIADGFAFQNKEFKVVKLAITEKKTDNANSGSENKSQSSSKNLDGMMEIGGFAFKVKPILSGDDKLEADIMEIPDPITTMEKGSEKKLQVPIGHISITAQQPDPKNRVYLGDLRINSEKAEGIEGTFELYLNDHTPNARPGRKEKPDKQ